MRAELRRLLIDALALPSEEMAGLLGEVEEFKIRAMMRLATPALANGPDELLDVEEAARRLGVTVDHLYRHSVDYGFTRKVGKRLRFSASGIEQYIRQNRIQVLSTADERGTASEFGIAKNRRRPKG